ncbi:MAG: uroporphyrinogen-III C-methyltransferase [Gammaproteobacteria bacterium]|jgi:uroporphyrin-3 C-methyltransferase
MTEKKEDKATSAKENKSPENKLGNKPDQKNEKKSDNKTLAQSNKAEKVADKKAENNNKAKSDSTKSNSAKPSNVKPENKKSGNILFYVITVILIVLISASFVFLNNRLDKLDKELEQNTVDNSNVEENIAADIDARLETVLSNVSNVQQKLGELQSKQDVLSHSLSQPVEQQVHINKDYALAEVEHLLIIANYNLQLDHNVATALSAMEAVDKRLQAFNDAAALSAREQLIADMNQLRSLNQADLSGMALYLSDLISRVDELALKENIVIEQQLQTDDQEQDTQEPVEGIKHFFALVWEELKSLVVITRDNDVAAARLLPDEVYFLRANLKLELANARFAVFNRDTENLHASIKHMQAWLHAYFDIADAGVRNVSDTLTAMKKIELEFPELDISSSLESVRALSRIKEDSIDDGNNATGTTIE